MPTGREQVLDAVETIIATRGLDGVSIREVAAAAGVSIGMVQYYCRSKDEMLVMAFEAVAERIQRRVEADDRSGTVGDQMFRGLLELLPIDELRTREARICLAFTARSLASPTLAAVRYRLVTGLREQCAEAYRGALALGETLTDEDPETLAAMTAAYIDGLLMHMLTDPPALSHDEGIAALARHLATYVRISVGTPA
jgi:AcrR family transcriptional regulator